VQMNLGYHTVARRFPIMMAAVLLMGLSHSAHSGGNTVTMPALVVQTHLAQAQAPATQVSGADKPTGSTSITRGMGKEAVRTEWGEPEEIRKIRTCFGWQEEWVYRGDPNRFGVSERVLLFDEGEVLSEIK
jgi:hypothetical protein